MWKLVQLPIHTFPRKISVYLCIKLGRLGPVLKRVVSVIYYFRTPAMRYSRQTMQPMRLHPLEQSDYLMTVLFVCDTAATTSSAMYDSVKMQA